VANPLDHFYGNKPKVLENGFRSWTATKIGKKWFWGSRDEWPYDL